MNDRAKTHTSALQKGIVSTFQGLQLLLIQCSVCVICILVVLCLRWAGGDLFNSIASLFRQSMLDNTLVSAVTNKINVPVVSAMTAPSPPDIVAPFEGGVITSKYGMRDGTKHEGLDIGIEEGTPLKAMMDGTVTVSEYNEGGYGYYLIVDCSDSEQYLYAHCQKLNVAVGEKVKAGDIIAFAGNTGRSTGSHLHIEWICNGQTIDPMQILPEATYA